MDEPFLEQLDRPSRVSSLPKPFTVDGGRKDCIAHP